MLHYSTLIFLPWPHQNTGHIWFLTKTIKYPFHQHLVEPILQMQNTIFSSHANLRMKKYMTRDNPAIAPRFWKRKKDEKSTHTTCMSINMHIRNNQETVHATPIIILNKLQTECNSSEIKEQKAIRVKTSF